MIKHKSTDKSYLQNELLEPAAWELIQQSLDKKLIHQLSQLTSNAITAIDNNENFKSEHWDDLCNFFPITDLEILYKYLQKLALYSKQEELQSFIKTYLRHFS